MFLYSTLCVSNVTLSFGADQVLHRNTKRSLSPVSGRDPNPGTTRTCSNPFPCRRDVNVTEEKLGFLYPP